VASQFGMLRGFCLGAAVVGVIHVAPLDAQTRSEGPWWPSALWGPDDQAGASNWITPEKVLEAISLVRTGQIYELGYPYEPDMPMLGTRKYASVLIPGRAAAPGGSVFNEEFVAGEIGQAGTQFDGLGHVGRQVEMEDGSVADVFYNGFTSAEMQSRNGLRELGVEKIRPYVTRGIMIDLAAHMGPLPNAYRVSLAEVEATLEAQGMTSQDIRPGDAIILNLGWSNLWDEPERVARDWSDRPNVMSEVLDWLVARNPSLVGWDTAGNGAGHSVLTNYNGIPTLEFMNLSSLSEDRVYEFAFIFTPLRLTGGTGSPGRPLAIR